MQRGRWNIIKYQMNRKNGRCRQKVTIAGGLDLGFKKAGFNVVMANEFASLY